MAGPMVGPLLERLGLELDRDLLDARRQLPRPRAQPAAARRTASSSSSKVRETGADLGIAWDGDADRCFFIDDTGEFVDGDFLTALLAESLLAQAARARRSSTTCAPRGRSPDTVDARRRHARCINRVGHAFFKTRMREEGVAVRRRGLRPLLLPRLLLRRLGHDPGAADARAALARGQAAVASCSRPTASATSSPARSTPRSPTSRRRWRRSPSATPTRDQDRLDGISIDYDDWHFNVRPSNTEPLLRLCLESLRLARGHGAPPRRGARADPLVSDDRSRRRRAASARSAAERHPPPGDPDAVRGRAGQLLPDRGRAADAGRLRARTRPRRSTSSSRRCAERGPRVEDLELLVVTHQHIDHLGLASDPRAALGRRGRARSTALAPVPGELRRASRARRPLRRGADAAPRHPARTSSPRCARCRRASAPGARRATVTRPLRRRRASSSFATARCGCCTGPGHSPSDTVFWDERARRCCSPPTT